MDIKSERNRRSLNMLDLKMVLKNLPETIKALKTRGGNFGYLTEIVLLDERKREIISELENLRLAQNTVSKLIAKNKNEVENLTDLRQESSKMRKNIKLLEEELVKVQQKIEHVLLMTPNIPHVSVPVGDDAGDNLEIRRFKEPTSFNFSPKPHWDLMTDLKMIDFERANRMTGRRFAIYLGLGATLERALINFMLDLHIRTHGYMEVMPPYVVNQQSLMGTGQLPKLEHDLFKIENSNYYLIPTAEVPLTNLHYNEILAGEDLPLNYVAYTPCFRSEVGAAGRDTRGLIRQHQFNKVELVKFVRPEETDEALEMLTIHAEKILQLLELPYRVVELCTGDLGFTSSKTHDIEVWLPSYQDYKEISSCSQFGDFQARRANIKFRCESKRKAEFVHTLNGSGLAVGRTVAAIVENYQQEDGSIVIPEVLRPYMGGVDLISNVVQQSDI